MTTETQTPTNWFEWAIANWNKIKSVGLAASAYILAIEAAHPNQDFWETFTSGVGGALAIAFGLVTAAISGYRTSEEPGKLAKKRIQTINDNLEGGH